MGSIPRVKLVVIGQPQAREINRVKREIPTTQQVRQRDLEDILYLKAEVEMIKEDIKRAEVRVLAALMAGARVESGPHSVQITGRKKVRIDAFRGAIFR